MKTSIKISREHSDIKMPAKRAEDAGYDVFVDPKWLAEQEDGAVIIMPNETVMLPTGLRSVIKSGYYAQIQERGSTGVIGMKYGAGVIDSNFRGVWSVVLTNCSNKAKVITTPENYDKLIKKSVELLKDNFPEDENINEEYVKSIHTFYDSNKGVAQFVLLPVPVVRIDEVTVEDILAETSERGEDKLGSTNK